MWVHLWVPHTSLTSHAPRVGQSQNVGLRDFCHISTLLPPGASLFHKLMSSLPGDLEFWLTFFFNVAITFIPEETFILHFIIPVRRPSHGTIIVYLDTLTWKFDIFFNSFNLGCYLLMVVPKRASLLLTTFLFAVGVGYFVIGLPSDIFLILLQTHCRGQGSLFLVIFAMYSNVMEGGGCFFQTHSRDQRSLFLVIFAMYSNAMGRDRGVMFLSDTL